MSYLSANHLGPIAGLLAAPFCLWLTGCTSLDPVTIGNDACDPGACGVAPKLANYSCPDGTLGGPTGQCIKNPSGTCEWQIKACTGGCVPGTTKLAEDGCNQCQCTDQSTWACTEKACADGSCTQDGQIYPNGSGVPSLDGCNSCGCNDGKIICTTMACLCKQGETKLADDGCNQCTCGADGTWACTEKLCLDQSCLYEGKVYPGGSGFPSSDGCNTCSCNQGKVICTLRACSA